LLCQAHGTTSLTTNFWFITRYSKSLTAHHTLVGRKNTRSCAGAFPTDETHQDVCYTTRFKTKVVVLALWDVAA
jgi:hypothetical protein